MFVDLVLTPLPLVVRRRLLDYTNIIHDAPTSSSSRQRSAVDDDIKPQDPQQRPSSSSSPSFLAQIAVDPIAAMWDQELNSVRSTVGGSSNLSIVPHWLEVVNPPLLPASMFANNKSSSSSNFANIARDEPVLGATLFLPAPASQLVAHLESNFSGGSADLLHGASAAATSFFRRGVGAGSSSSYFGGGGGGGGGGGTGAGNGGGGGSLKPVLLPTTEEMAVFLAPRDPRLLLQRQYEQQQKRRAGKGAGNGVGSSTREYTLQKSGDPLFRDLENCPGLMQRLCDSGQSIWLAGTRAPFVEPLTLSKTLLERFCSCLHLALQHAAMTARQLKEEQMRRDNVMAAASFPTPPRGNGDSTGGDTPSHLVPSLPLALIGPSRFVVSASTSEDAPPHFGGPLADFLVKCFYLGRGRRPLYGESRELLLALFALGGIVPTTLASGKQSNNSTSTGLMFTSSGAHGGEKSAGKRGYGGSQSSSAANSRSGSADSAAQSVASSAQRSSKSGGTAAAGAAASASSSRPFSGAANSHPHSASHAALPPPPVSVVFSSPTELSDMLAGVNDIMPPAVLVGGGGGGGDAALHGKMTEAARVSTSMLAAAHATLMRASGVCLPMPQTSEVPAPSLEIAHRTLLVVRNLIETLGISCSSGSQHLQQQQQQTSSGNSAMPASSSSSSSAPSANPSVPIVLRCDMSVERRRTFVSGDNNHQHSSGGGGSSSTGGGGGDDSEPERIYGVACRWIPEMIDIRSVLSCIANERRPTLQDAAAASSSSRRQQQQQVLPTIARKPMRPLALKILHILTDVCAVRPQQQSSAAHQSAHSINVNSNEQRHTDSSRAEEEEKDDEDAFLLGIATQFGSDYAEVILEALISVLHLAADLELASEEASNWRRSKRQVLLSGSAGLESSGGGSDDRNSSSNMRSQQTVAFCEVMRRSLHSAVMKGLTLDQETTTLFVAHLLDDGLSLDALQSRLRSFAADVTWSMLLWIFDTAQVWAPVRMVPAGSGTSNLKPRKPVPHRVSFRFLSGSREDEKGQDDDATRRNNNNSGRRYVLRGDHHDDAVEREENQTGAAIVENLFEDNDLDDLEPLKVMSDFDADPIASIKRRLLYKKKPSLPSVASSFGETFRNLSFMGRPQSFATGGDNSNSNKNNLDDLYREDFEDDEAIQEQIVMLENKNSSNNLGRGGGGALSAPTARRNSASFGPLISSSAPSGVFPAADSSSATGKTANNNNNNNNNSNSSSCMSPCDKIRYELLLKFCASTTASRKNLLPGLRATSPLHARMTRITLHESSKVFLHAGSGSAAASAMMSDEQLVSAGTWNLWTAETRERLLAVNPGSVLNFVRAPSGRMLLNRHFVSTTAQSLWHSGSAGVTASGVSSLPSTETAPGCIFFVSKSMIASKSSGSNFEEPLARAAQRQRDEKQSASSSSSLSSPSAAQHFAKDLTDVFGYPARRAVAGRSSASDNSDSRMQKPDSPSSFCAVDQGRNEQLRAMQFLWRNVVGLRAAAQTAMILDQFLAQFWVLVAQANWRRVDASRAEINGTAASASFIGAAASDPLLLDKLFALEERRITPTAIGGYGQQNEQRHVRRSPTREASPPRGRSSATTSPDRNRTGGSSSSNNLKSGAAAAVAAASHSSPASRSRPILIAKAIQSGFYDFPRRRPIEAVQWIAATLGMTFTNLSASASGSSDDPRLDTTATSSSFTPAESRIADLVFTSLRHGTIFINGFDTAATLGFARKAALAHTCVPLVKSRFLAAALSVRNVRYIALRKAKSALVMLKRFVWMQLAARTAQALLRRRFIEARSHEIEVSAVLEERREASQRRYRGMLSSAALLGTARELAAERPSTTRRAHSAINDSAAGGQGDSSILVLRSPELQVEVEDGTPLRPRRTRTTSPASHLAPAATPRNLRPSLLDLAEAAHLETPLSRPQLFNRKPIDNNNNNNSSSHLSSSLLAPATNNNNSSNSLSPPRASSFVPAPISRAYQRALSRSVATLAAVEVAERQRLVEREAMDARRMRERWQDLAPSMRMTRNEMNSRQAVLDKWVGGFAAILEEFVEPFFRGVVARSELMRRRYLRATNHNVSQTVLFAEESRGRLLIEQQQTRVATFLNHHSLIYDLTEQLQEMLSNNTDARAKFDREVATAAQMKVSALLAGGGGGGGSGAAASSGSSGGGASARGGGSNTRIAAVVRQAVQSEREPLHVRVQRSVYLQEADCLRSVLDFVPSAITAEEQSRTRIMQQFEREAIEARELGTRRRLERGSFSFVRRYATEFQLFLLPIVERDLRSSHAALSALYYTDIGKRFIVARNEQTSWEQLTLAERHEKREIERESSMWDTLFDDSYASPMRLLDALERDRAQIRQLMAKVQPLAREQQAAPARSSGMQNLNNNTAYQDYFEDQQRRRHLASNQSGVGGKNEKVVFLSNRTPHSTYASSTSGAAAAPVAGGSRNTNNKNRRQSQSPQRAFSQQQQQQQSLQRRAVTPDTAEMSPNSKILAAAGAVARSVPIGGASAFLQFPYAASPSSVAAVPAPPSRRPPSLPSAQQQESSPTPPLSVGPGGFAPTRVLPQTTEQQLLAEVMRRRAQEHAADSRQQRNRSKTKTW